METCAPSRVKIFSYNLKSHTVFLLFVKVVVANGVTVKVGDHDFSKCSLTPSVTLNIDIPEKISDSWYRGNVTISLKDTTFEPSSPSRHMVELLQLLDKDFNNDKPVLFLYTDGGPDHRCTFLSVQLSIIYIWLKKDFDQVILARTPPGNSYKNPVERVMSVINLAFQAVGVMRSKMDPENEKRMRGYASN